MKEQPEITDIEIDYLLQDIEQIKEFEKERFEDEYILTEENLFLEIYDSKRTINEEKS